jgi:hypothetical protein
MIIVISTNLNKKNLTFKTHFILILFKYSKLIKKKDKLFIKS